MHTLKSTAGNTAQPTAVTRAMPMQTTDFFISSGDRSLFTTALFEIFFARLPNLVPGTDTPSVDTVNPGRKGASRPSKDILSRRPM